MVVVAVVVATRSQAPVATIKALQKASKKQKTKQQRKDLKKCENKIAVNNYLFHKKFRIKGTSAITNANFKRNATANVTQFIHPDAELLF